VGKHDFSSMELAAKLGGVFLHQVPSLKVDLKNPKKEIFVEVRNNFCYLYTSEISGLKGLPLGVEGNVGVLFSGKKEEFLAALFALKRGCNVFPIIENPKNIPKVKSILKKLHPYNSFREFLLTPKKDIQKLIDAPDINLQAVIQADMKLTQKNIQDNFLNTIPIFRPLLFYSSKALNSELKEFLRVVK
jgi:adenylyl- and sulfurtransferase ThiI